MTRPSIPTLGDNIRDYGRSIGLITARLFMPFSCHLLHNSGDNDQIHRPLTHPVVEARTGWQRRVEAL